MSSKEVPNIAKHLEVEGSSRAGDGDPIANRPSRSAAESDGRLMYGAWACLSGADSVLSEIVHRYGSRLPDDVLRDADASYRECRKQAEKIKPRADELLPPPNDRRKT